MVDDISVQEKLDEKLSEGEITQEEYIELFEKFKKLGILEVKSTNLNSKSSSDHSYKSTTTYH